MENEKLLVAVCDRWPHSQKQLRHLGAPPVGGAHERCVTTIVTLGVDLGTGSSIGYRGEVARGAGWWCRGLGGYGVSDVGGYLTRGVGCVVVVVVVGEVWADPHLSAMLHENLGSGRGVVPSSIVQGGPVAVGGVGGVDVRGVVMLRPGVPCYL